MAVEGVLVEDLEERVSSEAVPPWRLAVTTFYRVYEVERAMQPRGVGTVVLLAEATPWGPRRLAGLPDGTPVGVVDNSRTCTDNLLRSLEGPASTTWGPLPGARGRAGGGFSPAG